jgi:methionine-rich copper-binding protein CopC
MQRIAICLIASLAAAGLPGVAVHAHAFLDKADPPVGGTVAAPPAAIRLIFTEAIEPAFSGVELLSTDGREVATGRATVDPANPTAFVLPLPRLPPGRYKVHWHVVSVDTHATQGDYSFEIRP